MVKNKQHIFIGIFLICVLLVFPCVNAESGVIWTPATTDAAFNARYDHASLVFDNKMWILGGIDDDNVLKNDVWSSSDGVTWTQITAAAPWTKRSGFASAVFENKIWVMGGYIGNDPTNSASYKNDVWYSSDGITWTQTTDNAGWSKREGTVGLAYNNKLWLLGGSNATNADMRDVWYSSDGITWTQATSTANWIGFNENIATVHNNKMWVIGIYGYPNRDGVFSSTDGITWEVTNSNAPFSGSGIRADFPLVSFDNKLWVLGGWNGTNAFNDVWSSSDGITWNQVCQTASWDARSDMAAVPYNSRLWVIGGFGRVQITGLYARNDTWYTSADSMIPTINGITPSSANIGQVIISEIAGSGFASGATVYLAKTGETSIPATNVVVSSSNKITCILNVTGAAPGLWDVVVQNPGLPAVSSSIFTVNAATPDVPVASFTATQKSETLDVEFTDTSANSPTSWAWDFQNDGTIDSTLQNPTFSYGKAGTYTVKLIAKNAGGSGVTTDSITVASVSQSTCKVQLRGINQIQILNFKTKTYHTRIIYTDSSGNKTIFEGGQGDTPTSLCSMHYLSDLGQTGRLVAAWSSNWDDSDSAGYSVPFLVHEGSDVCGKDDCIKKQIKIINSEERCYDVFTPNCNNVAYTLLEKCGFPTNTPPWRPLGWSSLDNFPRLTIMVDCPVDISITDPMGEVINNTNFGNYSIDYYEVDLDNDGEYDEVFVINNPIPGNYQLSVTPHLTALPMDTFTITMIYGETSKTLANNVQIKDIPSMPYIYTITDTSQSIASTSDSDNTILPVMTQATPTIGQSPSTITINVGGSSDVNTVTVTGINIKDLIVTGTVKSLSDGDPYPSGTAYQYIELIPARYSTITNAEIFFSVPQSWLEGHKFSSENIVLYHKTSEGWVPLPTMIITVKDGRVYYSATSTGFSLFAIVGNQENLTNMTQSAAKAPKEPLLTTMPVKTSITGSLITQQTISSSDSQNKPSGTPPFLNLIIIGGVVGIIIVTAFIIRRWWIRRQNPSLFRKED